MRQWSINCPRLIARACSWILAINFAQEVFLASHLAKPTEAKDDNLTA